MSIRGPSRRVRRKFLSSVNRLLILLILGSSPKPIYGYQIAKIIRELSEGKITVNTSTLYSMLRKMEKDGLIRSIWRKSSLGPPRRYYFITESGSQLFTEIITYLRIITKYAEKRKRIFEFKSD